MTANAGTPGKTNSPLQQLATTIGRFAGSIVVLILSLILTILSMLWVGYDFSLLSTVVIGDLGDSLNFTNFLYQTFDNLAHRPGDLGYGLFFFNEPNPMAYSTASYGVAVFALPIYIITGQNLILTLNIYIILTFVLTAWAVYLLIRYLLKAPGWVALIFGLAIGFSPFRFQHLPHIEILSMQFYFLAVYGFHRFLDSRRLSWAIFTVIMFWLIFFSHGNIGYMFILTATIILIYVMSVRRRIVTRRFILNSLIAIVLALVLFYPFLRFRLEESHSLSGYPLEVLQAGSATPANWFDSTAYIYYRPQPIGGERKIFIGFTLLILSLAAVPFSRSRRNQSDPIDSIDSMNSNETPTLPPRKVVTLYLIVFLAGYALTLGPALTLGENSVLPSPYLILYQLPGFSSLRVPARFIIISMLGAAVLASFTLLSLRRRLGWIGSIGVISVITFGLSVESMPYNANFNAARPSNSFLLYTPRTLPPRVSNTIVPIPINAYNWLSQQPAPAPVFHFPATLQANFQHMFAIHLHGQPIVNGAASFYPEWYARTDWGAFPNQQMLRLLQQRGIAYIFVHARFLSLDEQRTLGIRLTDYVDTGWLDRVDQMDDVTIYRLASIEPPSDRVRFEFDQNWGDPGWHNPERNDQGVTFTWMSLPTASLDLPRLQTDSDMEITFKVYRSLTPAMLESLQLSANAVEIDVAEQGQLVFRGTLPQAVLESSAGQIQLTFGIHEVMSPQVVSRSIDARDLGIAFDWLHMQRSMPQWSAMLNQMFDGAGWLADFNAMKGWLMLLDGNCFAAAVAFEQARTVDQNFPIPYAVLEQCGSLLPTSSNN